MDKLVEALERIAGGHIPGGGDMAIAGQWQALYGKLQDIAKEALAAPRATDAAGLVERLTRIADASKRDDGADIPLGEYCREAAATIAAQAAEIERLRGDVERAADERQAAIVAEARNHATGYRHCGEVETSEAFTGFADAIESGEWRKEPRT